MEELSKENLEHILELCSKTSQGPWVSYVEGRNHQSGSNFIMTGNEDIELIGATITDQDFIANAKKDIPKLNSEIFRLRALLEMDRNNNL
ncbi:hypothetical protein PY247_16300 [Acinetobacter proteolyticus]|nr:hypothetical protein [Acinetobacter proteolyticus]WEI17893.1 hypothetical protein PY247_16300 [Acinetobacter proteolyticus]